MSRILVASIRQPQYIPTSTSTSIFLQNSNLNKKKIYLMPIDFFLFEVSAISNIKTKIIKRKIQLIYEQMAHFKINCAKII